MSGIVAQPEGITYPPIDDLLEQVRKTGYHEDTIWAARHAVDAIRRGVVAIGA